MGNDWSHEEVEATVTDYFDMLNKELHGQSYNKTTHRRRLASLLNMRSDGAIERKHQNISAVLIKLGFRFIDGYKPLPNYQQLLYDIVSSHLNSSQRLIDIVRTQADQPAEIQVVDNILEASVEPPSYKHIEQKNYIREKRDLAVRQRVDYLAREAGNRSLGMAGEKFVIDFEKARLIHSGKGNLASKVEHISVTQGDSVGFDVLSFDITGNERFIEVKTTAYGVYTPFYVTGNELAISYKVASQYHLYRVFQFRSKARFFVKQGPLGQSFNLEPSQYIATLA